MTPQEALVYAAQAQMGPWQGAMASSDVLAYSPSMVTRPNDNLFGIFGGIVSNILGLTATGLDGTPDTPIFRSSFHFGQQDMPSAQAMLLKSNNTMQRRLTEAYQQEMARMASSFFGTESWMGGIVRESGDANARAALRKARSIASSPTLAAMIGGLVNQLTGYDRGRSMDVFRGRSNYIMGRFIPAEFGVSSDGRTVMDANSEDLAKRRTDLASILFRGTQKIMYDEYGGKNMGTTFGLSDLTMGKIMSSAAAAGRFDNLNRVVVGSDGRVERDENGNPRYEAELDESGNVRRDERGNIVYRTLGSIEEYSRYREDSIRPLLERKESLEIGLKKTEADAGAQNKYAELLRSRARVYRDNNDEETARRFELDAEKADRNAERIRSGIRDMRKSLSLGGVSRMNEESLKRYEKEVEDDLSAKKEDTVQAFNIAASGKSDQESRRKAVRSIAMARAKSAGEYVDVSENVNMYDVLSGLEKRHTALSNQKREDEASQVERDLGEVRDLIKRQEDQVDAIARDVDAVDEPLVRTMKKIAEEVGGAVDSLRSLFGSEEEALRQLNRISGGRAVTDEGAAMMVDMQMREIQNIGALAGVDPKQIGAMLMANQTLYSVRRGMSQADIAAGFGDNAVSNQLAIGQTMRLVSAMRGRNEQERRELEVQSRFGAATKANSTMHDMFVQLEYARQKGWITPDEYGDYVRDFTSGNRRTWELAEGRFSRRVYGDSESAGRQRSDVAQMLIMQEELDMEAGRKIDENLSRSHLGQTQSAVARAVAGSRNQVYRRRAYDAGVDPTRISESESIGRFEGIQRTLAAAAKSKETPEDQRDSAKMALEAMERLRVSLVKDGYTTAEADRRAVSLFREQYSRELGDLGESAEVAAIDSATRRYSDLVGSTAVRGVSDSGDALTSVLSTAGAVGNNGDVSLGSLSLAARTLFGGDVLGYSGFYDMLTKEQKSKFHDVQRKFRDQMSEAVTYDADGNLVIDTNKADEAYKTLSGFVGKLPKAVRKQWETVLGRELEGYRTEDRRIRETSSLSGESSAAEALSGESDATRIKYIRNIARFTSQDTGTLLSLDNAGRERLARYHEEAVAALGSETSGDGAKFLKALLSGKRSDWIALVKNNNISDEAFQEKAFDFFTRVFEKIGVSKLSDVASAYGVEGPDAANPEAAAAAAAASLTASLREQAKEERDKRRRLEELETEKRNGAVLSPEKEDELKQLRSDISDIDRLNQLEAEDREAVANGTGLSEEKAKELEELRNKVGGSIIDLSRTKSDDIRRNEARLKELEDKGIENLGEEEKAEYSRLSREREARSASDKDKAGGEPGKDSVSGVVSDISSSVRGIKDNTSAIKDRIVGGTGRDREGGGDSNPPGAEPARHDPEPPLPDSHAGRADEPALSRDDDVTMAEPGSNQRGQDIQVSFTESTEQNMYNLMDELKEMVAAVRSLCGVLGQPSVGGTSAGGIMRT